MPLIVEAQLSAPGANAVRYTVYPSAPGVRDPVFVFCNSSGTQTGNLNAVSPGGTAPFTFSWFKWDNASLGFTIAVKNETGVAGSSVNNLEEGGYRVNITDGSGYSAALTAWIFLDAPFSLAKLQNRTCDYVALSGKAEVDPFSYYDPANGNPVSLPNGVRFLWSSTPSSSIPYPDIELNPQTFNPPLEDVTYTLLVTDSLTCTSGSTFDYESIHIKAGFTVSPMSGGAPLEVVFTDESVRAASYKWEFGDDSTSFLSSSPLHTYYIPGKYSAKLTVESSLHCIDSMRVDNITVEESSLQIPNVFTPNGDGINDIFRIEQTSLKYVSVDIFSRAGIKVYSVYADGKFLKEWDGWDGNVNNTSFRASPGVYFYVIKALGWDDVKYDNKEYRGFVYLYR